jgi:hypothetical protein
MPCGDARSPGLSWQEGTHEFYTSHRETMPARSAKSREASSRNEALLAGVHATHSAWNIVDLMHRLA